ncbi:MAG TPA: adenylate/guanylate cyclase domain-containing protein [Acidimicrobiia bacterium]|nr:adenylate/guanylate cyclase domain-containing protein [Acidimicrobiia bacterium]
MTCPACGATTAAGARFCQECGQRLGVSLEERRLATVLMADLVGFTAISAGADPEQIKRLVDHCFEQLVADITEFGGRLDKIVGDEIIAIFGAPIAHEDDAERAVRAALRMQETMQTVASEIGIPVQVRIGVNSGEVLVGAMRAGGDPTAMGDVVNTAQRLEKVGEPGHVTVGPATELATRQAIRYESLGPVTLRGRGEPIEAFRAIDALTPPGRRRTHKQSPLVGRDAELATLRGLMKMALTRERAHLVFLVGDAGVGKSRLASELGEIASCELGATVLTAECLPYGDPNAFGPIAEALRQAAGVEGAHGGPASKPHVAEKTARVLGPETDAAELERVVEGLMYLLEGVARAGVDPSRARDEALRSALAVLEGIALRKPLVLLLSDLHWASDETLELCERLLTRLKNRPFLLIATARPDIETRWTPEPGKYNGITLQLDPLDKEATGELVRALLDGSADPETVTLLLERSGGNPFFIEELVAFMLESGDRSRIREVPATLHGLLAARLDALDPAERSLLEDCAIVGANGPIAAVLRLADRSDGQQVLDRLSSRDLIDIDDDDDFHFKSDLVHEIAYGTLTKAERARRHARVAPILDERGEAESDAVAHHLASAAELVAELGTVPGVPVDIREQAIAALQRAADRAELAESWMLVSQHHGRALGLLDPEPGPVRWRALLGRGKASVQQRRIDAARDDLLTVLTEAKAAGELRPQAEALTQLGSAEIAVGAYDAADETLAAALEFWRELGDDAGGADVLRELGVSHLFRGDLVQAERFVSEALAAYRAAGRERGAAWALQNLAWISFTRGDVSHAEERLQQSAGAFAELGDWGGLGWAYGLLAFVRYNQGRLEEAVALAEHIAIDGRETGNRWAVGMMSVLIANVRLWTGRMAESVARGQEAIALFQEIGDRWGEVMATGPVVRALAELGRDGEYADTLAHYRAISRDMPDEGMRTFPEVMESLVDLQQGRPEAAQAILESLELAHSTDDSGQLGFADGCAAVGLGLLQLGKVDDAIEILARGYAGVTEDGPLMSIGSRLALAYAAAQRPDDAERVIAEMKPRSGGTFSDRMLALWSEAFVGTQQGSPDAREPVDAAYEIAIGTDAPLEHAIAALARSKVLAALGADDAPAAAEESEARLAEVGLTCDGWARVFDLALVDVSVPS